MRRREKAERTEDEGQEISPACFSPETPNSPTGTCIESSSRPVFKSPCSQSLTQVACALKVPAGLLTPWSICSWLRNISLEEIHSVDLLTFYTIISWQRGRWGRQADSHFPRTLSYRLLHSTGRYQSSIPYFMYTVQ